MTKDAQPHRKNTMAAALAIVLFALPAGCGGSGPKSTAAGKTAAGASTQAPPTTTTGPATNTATTTQATTTTTPTASTPAKAAEHVAPNERVEVTSSAIHNGVLPARYTCDGRDTPPPLRWKGIPSHTAELMLDIIKIKPIDNKLYFPWAVTHIKPTTHGITGSKLPPGAVVGTNGSGQTTYHLCPPKGSAEAYVAVLFALPHRLAAKPGFDPTALRLQAEHAASYQNLYIFKYTRH